VPVYDHDAAAGSGTPPVDGECIRRSEARNPSAERSRMEPSSRGDGHYTLFPGHSSCTILISMLKDQPKDSFAVKCRPSISPFEHQRRSSIVIKCLPATLVTNKFAEVGCWPPKVHAYQLPFMDTFSDSSISYSSSRFINTAQVDTQGRVYLLYSSLIYTLC
jgi:hypothetical protein